MRINLVIVTPSWLEAEIKPAVQLTFLPFSVPSQVKTFPPPIFASNFSFSSYELSIIVTLFFLIGSLIFFLMNLLEHFLYFFLAHVVQSRQ